MEDLKRLPLIDGKTWRVNSDAFRSSGVADQDTLTLRSSGSSTGVPRAFRWDARNLLLKLAAAERDRPVVAELIGTAWGRRQLWIFPERSTSLAMRRWLDARIVMPPGTVKRQRIAADLPCAEIAERLDRARPAVVYSHGSVAERFFRWSAWSQRETWLPRAWVYGGDAMSVGGRRRAEERGCRILSNYSSIEAGRIGFECERRDGYHLNVDLCAVRVVDSHGRDVEPGETGEVVVSNLHNRASVLFNVRTGDRAAFRGAPCPCGRTLPLLSPLAGRVWDTLRLTGGGEIDAADLLRAVEAEMEGLLEIQIVNPEPGRIAWRVVPLPGVDAAAAALRLETRSREVLGPSVSVTVDVREAIQPDSSGKWRVVVRE